ncbi:MAG: HDOD domain-containing protein [Gammaproteobacteria bacterium]|nr:HDOD domain-containing protein [Gammaproteobacteria bacterium]
MSTTTAEDFNAAAFKFVQGLAEDLSKDDLELPGFPDTVARLHQELGDESKSVQDIVNLINSEPALAARLIKLANSAAFNTSGREVSDPRAAITSLGFNVVRSTATAFAMTQMEQQEWLAPVRPNLAKIWRRSNGVAAICHVIGDVIPGVRADEAMAAGLFHQLGQLYLLTQAHREGLPVAENPSWDGVAENWHATIARAFIESWGMPESIAEAVENQDAVAQGDLAESSQLTRLLSAAKLYDGMQEAGNGIAGKVEELLNDVQLSGDGFLDLVGAHKDRISEIASTIS